MTQLASLILFALGTPLAGHALFLYFLGLPISKVDLGSYSGFALSFYGCVALSLLLGRALGAVFSNILGEFLSFLISRREKKILLANANADPITLYRYERMVSSTGVRISNDVRYGSSSGLIISAISLGFFAYVFAGGYLSIFMIVILTATFVFIWDIERLKLELVEHSQWRYEFWRERRKDGLSRAEHILIHREIEAKSDARSFAFPIKIFLRRVSLLFATFPSRTVEDLKSGDMKKFVALVSVVLVSAIFGKATFEKSAALTTVVTEGESTCGRLLIASNNGYFFSSGVSRDSWFFVPENRLIKIISDPNDATNCESRP